MAWNGGGSTKPPMAYNYVDSHGLNAGLGNSASTTFPAVYDSKPMQVDKPLTSWSILDRINPLTMTMTIITTANTYNYLVYYVLDLKSSNDGSIVPKNGVSTTLQE